jgi:predicted DNA-binding protein
MTTSVRLDPATERTLGRLSRTTGKSRSELIREAIRQLGAHADDGRAARSAYDRIEDLIGVLDRGPGNRAARSEDLLRAKFAARRTAR